MPRQPTNFRAFFPLLLAIILSLSACAGGAHTWHGSPYPEGTAAPEIQLTDMHGDLFRLSDQRGKAILIFFGYTYCPDICPATVGEVSWVFDQLGLDAADAAFLFITVDPERDTPEVLREYLGKFNPDFIGLRGDEPQLEQIEQAYGVFSQAEEHGEGEPYLVTHTARIFLVDPEGLLRTNYTFGADPEDILADLQFLVEGSG
jgi:protein SCO1/2